MESISGSNQSSLDAIVSRGHLRQLFKGRKVPSKFSPTPLDLEMLRVADAAVDTRVPTAIVLPLPSTRTPVILAAAMLISSFVKTEKMTQHVALVSHNIELREFYDALHLQAELPLAEYFLRTVVDSRGVAIESSTLPPEHMRKRGRLHFVSKAEKLQKLKLARSAVRVLPQGIVVESSACESTSIKELLDSFAGKIPIVYITVDPFDPAIKEFEKVGTVWAWDNTRISSLIGSVTGGNAICIQSGELKKAVDTIYEVVQPDTPDVLDDALKRLWEDLMAVASNPLGPGPEAIGWAWGVLSGLSQLAVPLPYYDRAARAAWGTAPLTEAPGKAELFARNAVGEAEEMWNILASDLEDAVEAASKSNPKVSSLVEWVSRCVEEGIGGVISARNRAAKNALEVFLNESTNVPYGWNEQIEVVSLSSLNSGRRVLNVPDVLFTGPLQPRFGWLLAMPLSDRVSILSHGSWEASRIVRQIQSVNSRLSDLANAKMRAEASEILFDDNSNNVSLETTTRSFMPEIKHSLSETKTESKEAAGAVWSPFSVTVASSLASSNEEVPEVTVSDSVEKDEKGAESLLVTFQDAAGYFQPNCPVSKITGKEVKEVAAKSLKAGDRVVLIERGARRDLFMLIVDKLETLPEMQIVVSLIQQWHERAKSSSEEKGLQPETILERMGDTEIKSPGTIAGWIKGSVHGPNKPENIRLFGIAVDDEFLTENWEVIGKALKTVRGHRIKLGRMLNAAINGLTPVDMENSGYFDRRLGIHFADMADALSVHTVVSVSDDVRVVPHTGVNKLVDNSTGSVQS